MAPISVLSNDDNIEPAWVDFLGKAVGLDTTSISTAGSQYSFAASQFWNTIFSSSSNLAVIGDERASLDIGQDHGLLTTITSLKLPSVNLSTEVFRVFGVGQLGSDVQKVLKILDSVGSVVLDAGPRWKGGFARNAMWFLPVLEDGKDMQVTTSLSFKLPSDFSGELTGLTDLLQTFGVRLDTSSLDHAADVLKNLSITVQKTTFGIIGADSVTSQVLSGEDVNFTIRIPVKNFDLYIKCGADGVQLDLREGIDSIAGDEGLWSDISSLFQISRGAAEPSWGTVLNNIHVWYVTIQASPGGFSFKVGVVLQWSAGTNPISFALTYDKDAQPQFNGKLLVQTDFNDIAFPSFDVVFDPPPSAVDIESSFDLKDFFTQFVTLPEGIPTKVTKAELDFDKTKQLLHFNADIPQPHSDPTDQAVPAPFSWDEVKVTLTKDKTDTAFHIESTFILNPPQPDTEHLGTGNLVLSVDYVNGSWQVSGQAKNIHFSQLTNFLDHGNKNGLLHVLGEISIKTLDVYYNYTGASGARTKASSFVFAIVITCGELELEMFYQYVGEGIVDKANTAAQKIITAKTNEDPDHKTPPPYDHLDPLVATAGGSAWRFDAYLGVDHGGATIGSVIDSIVPSASGSIPTFARSIKVEATPGTSPVSLVIKKPAGGEVIFTLDVVISIVEFTFAQISGDNADSTKRILRISVAKIPLLDQLPVIKELPQPFQKLVYLWVTGDAALMQTQADDINEQLTDAAKIVYKSSTNPADGQDPAEHAAENPVLEAGHHFIVIEDNKVVLDHVFNNANTTSAPQADPLARDSMKLVGRGAAASPPEEEPSPTKGVLNKISQFLNISGLALQYKNETLWVMMDATVTLGPISLSLLGFGIGLHITNLSDLSGLSPAFELHGMAMSFIRPPLTIAGVFEHVQLVLPEQSVDAYRGGIAVGFPPYTFVAVGEYATVTITVTGDGTREYKSVFIYAKLNGPLISLEFATISGVRLGFGYNSMVRSPALEELSSFPFLNDGGTSEAGNDPMKILDTLRRSDNPWINVKEDAYWFAVGMTVDAFDILSVTAVALIAFRDAGLIISIFANAIAQLPPSAANTDTTFMIMYVEIDMVAEMNFVDQYFRVEASLAPTSFLLVPQCHLYGGFALCNWFGSNPHAGDWVFSVGGYHRAFVIPDHYPRPQRLGISFRIGDNMSITGETYFAITPKCVMGGAMIHVSLSVGPVSAYLDTSFDALINFHPIHYIVDLRIAVGVECDIDVWFIHAHISVHIGADLHVEGPEFGGVAHVDFWFFGFDVSFGDYNQIPPAMLLIDFFDLVHKAGPVGSDQPDKDKPPADVIIDLKFALEDGAFPKGVNDTATGAPPEDTGVGAMWHVKGGSFRFRIACDFALSDAALETSESDSAPKDAQGNETDEAKAKRATVPAAQGVQSIFSTPMHINTPIKSTLVVTIRDEENSTVVDDWSASFIVKPVPVALWGSYDPQNDPLRKRPDSLLNASGAVEPLCMGVTIIAPPPRLAISKIPAFNATEMAKRAVPDPRATKDSWWWTLLFPDPVVQNSFLPKTLDSLSAKPEDDWKKIQTTWEDACTNNADVAAEAAMAIENVLGWNKPAPEVVQRVGNVTPKPWELNVGLPARLVTGIKDPESVMDGLENTYLALPRLVKV